VGVPGELHHFRGRQRRIRGNGFSFNPKALIESISCHNLLSLPGLGPKTVITLISECGLDMTRWPSEKHFVSWLGLSPQNKISGGKVLSSRTRQGATRAGSTAAGELCWTEKPWEGSA
jgi:transposase